MLTINLVRCTSWEHAQALRHMAESDGYPAAIAHIKHATTGEENFAFTAFAPPFYAAGLAPLAAEFIAEPTGASHLRHMALKNGARRDRVPAESYGKMLGILVKGLETAAAGTGFDVLDVEPMNPEGGGLELRCPGEPHRRKAEPSAVTGRDPLLDPNAF